MTRANFGEGQVVVYDLAGILGLLGIGLPQFRVFCGLVGCDLPAGPTSTSAASARPRPSASSDMAHGRRLVAAIGCQARGAPKLQSVPEGFGGTARRCGSSGPLGVSRGRPGRNSSPGRGQAGSLPLLLRRPRLEQEVPAPASRTSP